MTAPKPPTLAYLAPCPTCQQLVTWFHAPGEPFPRCACTRPTCRTDEIVEK